MLNRQEIKNKLYELLDEIGAIETDEEGNRTLLGSMDSIQFISLIVEIEECFNIEIPDEYLDDFIPKLILQPLVENVIKHAFADKEDKGFIGIVASEKEGKRLEITIFDNGKGIEKDTLQEICEKLNQQVLQDEFKSIGLQNVQARLKLLFGEEYGLMIKSTAGIGTAVKVTFPILTQKDVQDGCINYSS